MSLSSEPTRPLTSREVANLLSALFGGMIMIGTKPEDVLAAVEHFYHNQDYYRNFYSVMLGPSEDESVRKS